MARRLRHLRRGDVLRRRHDHAGDLGARRGRGPRGHRARAASVHRAGDARDHRRAVRDPEARHGERRRAVRPGDVRVVRRARGARASSQIVAAARGAGGAQSRATRSRFIAAQSARSRSSRSAPSCSPSPAPRRCTPTWGTSARAPIRRAWLFFVMPALVLNYFGQGALLLDRPDGDQESVLPARAGSGRCIPLVVLATVRGGHRVAGGDLGRVLADARGDPDGLLPAAHDRAHVRARRSGRSTCRSSTGRCSSR